MSTPDILPHNLYNGLRPISCADAVALANLHRSSDLAVLAQTGEHSMRLHNTFLTHKSARQADALRYPSPVSEDGMVSVAGPEQTPANTVSVPQLRREPARKYAYVDSIVDTATLFVEALWPLRGNLAVCHAQRTELNRFLTNTIRISKTSLSTLQLALFYCLRLRREQASPAALALPAQDRCPCPRLNFLSALILASKYLQDRNFSNRAWSKISGVPVEVLNLRERTFLRLVNWNLALNQTGFSQWAQYLERFVADVRDNLLFGDILLCRERWHFVVETQLVCAPEDDLARVIAICGSALAGPQLTIVADVAPGRPSLHLLPPSPPLSCHGARFELSPSCLQPAAAIDQPCPFFDEFVKSTPKESPLEAAADQCPTPDSLPLLSPTPSLLSSASPASSTGELGETQPRDRCRKRESTEVADAPAEKKACLARTGSEGSFTKI